MNKYDLVIFDLDGTLLDTTEGIMDSVIYTINSMSLHMLEKDDFKQFIGPPIIETFGKVYGLNMDDAKKATDIFRDVYKEKNLYKAIEYEGICNLLRTLSERNIKNAVATYKREDYAKKLINNYYFKKYLNYIYGSDDNNFLKKSDIIEKCIVKSNIIDRNRIVMVGDTEFDYIGAKEAKIDFISVNYGFGFKDKLKKLGNYHIGYVDKPIEILNYII